MHNFEDGLTRQARAILWQEFLGPDHGVWKSRLGRVDFSEIYRQFREWVAAGAVRRQL
jgi:hypothetical protein